ncbi:MAG: MogA/MoaB family molybdenum cofactor biosynthesis protein [Kurthia gibsonii]|uniref:Molybdenum cofactor biosynthesis protein B n=1 Tax=Kurthia gibsonii TaxID=33946 RepID=A0ABU9LLR5_9BACL|nr:MULTISPECIES: MogA/MoaB family molybdenum cofactor biosynthesis protein [Kurthia]MCA9725148.1 MogA/MoaB family molybdenum cofactor biosynthesis protein [Kurthia sp.]MEB7772974.1 MogA/MoaB family molybdenum cofactor biosynthesis protein [Kurthia gibsonii]RXH51597.1 MogA/MoaB family molybdenum cofactor biosynthesis protein [Kurthia gibsonii]WIL38467.1 MogA/MoaB family molybdenum cofactor biosynthesis protein [Kurthia sp. YJT4]HZG10988.1 MogA/MoaB family molybdenum cofactor biosynthesis protei
MHPTHQEVAIHAAILTVSDTRTKDTDTGGQLIHTLLQDAKFEVADYVIERDEPIQILEHVRQWSAQEHINTIIITGGTGFSQRDQTYDAITPLFEKEMIGFGELFRSLSYDEIGPKAMFSRATAGCFKQTAIYVIPGSKNAVNLAMQKLILPTVQHFVGELHRI